MPSWKKVIISGSSAELSSLLVSGNTIINGPLAVGTSSIGPTENTLTLGARDSVQEGGQLGFNASGGTYTSASFIDLYQNRLRILKGTNATSTGEVANWNMHNLQMALPAYSSVSSFPGTAAGYLAFDAGGNVITVAAGNPFPFTGSAQITGSLVITGSLSVSAGITGSLQGTASFASTASFVTGSNVFGPFGANSVISASFAVSASRALTSSFALTATSASYAATSSFSLATSENRILVINKSGNTISKGVVVHLTGSTNSSDTPYITTASYESDGLSANTLGITAESIAFNSTGYITTEGVLTGLNVTGFEAGQLVYLGANGSIIGTAPQAPLHSVRLGQVVRDSPSNNGSIYVRIDNGYELGELHDIIDSTTISTFGDLLVKSGSVWTNSKQLTGSYGLTGSLVVTGSTSADLVRITQTGTGNAFVVEDSTNPDATPFIITNAGRVGVGILSPTVQLDVSGSVEIIESASYIQDGQNVIYIAKSTNPVTTTYTNTIAGASAAEGTAYFDQMTAFGYQALYRSSGSDQTAFGYAAGYANTGSSQTLIGWAAGYRGKASNQTAVGYQAGFENSGSNQTAIGNGAGFQNTATQQTAVGLQAGYLNIGSAQTAVGQQAGQSNSASLQTAVGYAAGFQNSGSLQVAIGANAGRDNTGINQTAVGYDAGRLNSGSNQSAFGNDAGYQNTGISQTAIGVNAGYQNSGSYQTTMGVNAGYQNLASYQTAVGINAGRNNSGSTQTAIGNEAGRLNSGTNQTAIGSDSGYRNTAVGQTAVGVFAGYENSGSYQVALGNSAGVSNTGSNQVAVGYQAGRRNTQDYQTAVGFESGYFNTGLNQSAFGWRAGYQNSGSNQTVVGVSAGYQNSGSNQTAMGFAAGVNNTSSNQTAIGALAGQYQSGSSQTALGMLAGSRNSGSNQTATGYSAGEFNSARDQTAVGYAAGRYNIGSAQTAVGYGAGTLNSGSNQTAVGYGSGQSNSGSNQTAIGVQAGFQNSGSAQTTVGYFAGAYNSGSDNTNIGYQAGLYIAGTGGTFNSQSAQSVFLGSQTTAGGSNRINQIVIGYNASGIGSNSVVLGNSSILTTALRGFVGIGITTPTASLHITNTSTSASFLVEDNTNPDSTPFIIDATGNVGIGTTVPTAKLDVNGSFRFGPTGPGSVYFRSWDYGTDMDISSVTAGGWARAHRIITSDTGGAVYFGAYGSDTTSERAYWTIGTTGSVEIGHAFTTGVHLLKNGNVGIGTYVPTAKLHITNTSTSASFLVEDNTNPDSTPFIIDASGNVGIGTTSPTAKLTVQVTGSAANALVANFIKSPAAFNETGSTFIRISNFPTLFTGSGQYTDIEYNTSVAGPYRYGTYGDTNIINGNHSTTGNHGSINFVTSGSTRMTVAGGTSAGNVGIGTTDPSASLHLYRTVDPNILTIERGNAFNVSVRYVNTIGAMHTGLNSTGSFVIGQTNDFSNVTTSFLTVSQSGNIGIGTISPTAKLHITHTGSGNSFLVEDSTNPDTTPFVIDSSGNVGIGKLSPNATLDVSGSTIISGSLTVTGGITGSITASGVFGPYGSNSVITSSFAVTASYFNATIQTLGTSIYSTNPPAGPNFNTTRGIFIGTGSGLDSVGSDKIAIGTDAGKLNTGTETVAIGERAGESNSTDFQVAIGLNAGRSNSGDVQTAIGLGTGLFNTGDSQTAVGSGAGSSNTGNSQTAVGSGAGSSNTGDFQTAVGPQAGQNNIGVNQTAVGFNAGADNSGDNQVAIGQSAGSSNTGSNNVNIGYQAGSYVNIGAPGLNFSSSNSVFLGADTAAGGAARINQIVIGYGTEGIGSNSVIIGNTDIEVTALRGKVGVNKTTPNAQLDVNGDTIISGSLTVTGSYNSPSGNTIDSNALIQASLLYLSNNF